MAIRRRKDENAWGDKRNKRPPAKAYENLMHVARCKETGELWTVRSDDLGSLASRSEPCEVMGPMWVGPMHDGEFLAGMAEQARQDGHFHMMGSQSVRLRVPKNMQKVCDLGPWGPPLKNF